MRRKSYTHENKERDQEETKCIKEIYKNKMMRMRKQNFRRK